MTTRYITNKVDTWQLDNFSGFSLLRIDDSEFSDWVIVGRTGKSERVVICMASHYDRGNLEQQYYRFQQWLADEDGGSLFRFFWRGVVDKERE